MSKTELELREEAASAGLVKYQGKPCKRGCGTERYVSNGGCVECILSRTQRANKRIGTVLRANHEDRRRKVIIRRSELLENGGARTAEETKEGMLDWYVLDQPLQCEHSLVKLDGFTCHQCGLVDGKRRLEIAAKLLS
jgi:hypothetical protein